MAGFDKTTSGAEVVAAFPEAIKGKTIVITGPTAGGLGAQTAIFLAQGKPAQLFLLGRTESKAASVIEEIKSISPTTSVKFVQGDLTRFDSIRTAAATINASVEKIDILINNAGIMAVKEYTLTPEGLESQFGANYVGHFLLTNLLMPKILAAGNGARIVNLTSIGYQMEEMRFDDYNFSDGKAYNQWLAYGQSKTANILFSVALASKLAPKGVLAYSVHPGSIITNLGTHVDPSEWPGLAEILQSKGQEIQFPYKDLAQGAATTLIAALDPSLESSSGAYLDDSVVGKPNDYAIDPVLAERLWALSEKIVGEKFSY